MLLKLILVNLLISISGSFIRPLAYTITANSIHEEIQRLMDAGCFLTLEYKTEDNAGNPLILYLLSLLQMLNKMYRKLLYLFFEKNLLGFIKSNITPITSTSSRIFIKHSFMSNAGNTENDEDDTAKIGNQEYFQMALQAPNTIYALAGTLKTIWNYENHKKTADYGMEMVYAT